MPSRLIGHRLRVRLFDDRLELYSGATRLETLVRGRGDAAGNRAHVIDYRHLIHSLRRKPMALAALVYREQLFPREAYRRTYHTLLAQAGERVACRTVVELLALAHERSCEGELADALTLMLDAGEAPDLASLRARFGPLRHSLPSVDVKLPSLAGYDTLLTPAVTRDTTAVALAGERP